MHFEDGRETLNFLLRKGAGPQREGGVFYLLLLDIRMPIVDGIEVMRRIKQDDQLCNIPITMVTTTEDHAEIDKCRELGCRNHFVKPVSSYKFSETMQQLGQ